MEDKLDSDKLEAMRLAWEKINEQLAFVETLENRTTVLMCTFLILLPAFFLRYDTDLTTNVTVSMSMAQILRWFIIATALVTIWFQLKNHYRARWLCRTIVRIEQALRYYDFDYYITSEKLKELKNRFTKIKLGFEEPTLMDPSGQKWGKHREWQLYITPHIAALVLAATASFIMIKFLA